MNISIKMLKRVSVILIMLTPLPSGKVIIFSGLTIVFQFFNSIFLNLTSEFQQNLLNELILAIIYILSITIMLLKKDRAFIIGFILNMLFWSFIINYDSLKRLEFIIPFFLNIIFSIYTSIRIIKKT